MSTPVFDFTTRAKPIVQFGRSVHRLLGNDKWGRAHWGVGRWGARDWEPVWTDITCEVHEITTDTGRGGATDRFQPGTAYIVASNVTGLSELIFPPVPAAPYEIELVPQPPIEHEEDLQAPGATTVVSNGWSFSDDFETALPRWIFPSAWAATGAAPYGPFKPIGGTFQPELYEPATNNYQGNAAAQWTGHYDPAGNSSLQVVADDLDWPAATTGGTPQIVVDLMLRMNTSDKECFCSRFTFTPNFSGANTISIRPFHMAADGTVAAGPSATSFTVGTGTGGVFGPRTLTAAVTVEGELEGAVSGVSGADVFWTVDGPLSGSRVGMAVHYEQGVSTTAKDAPAITAASGTSTGGGDFIDDMSRPLGVGWLKPAWTTYTPMIQDGGAMQPAQVFDTGLGGGRYSALSVAQWVSDFDGDQVFEMEISNMSAPRPSGHFATQTDFEIYTHGFRSNQACMVARVNYDPGWGTTHSIIRWSFWQYGPNGEFIDYAPSISGSIDVGATDGVFPEPARWRVESDLTGEQRIYHNGVLQGTAMAPAPTTGGRIGIRADWTADDLFHNDQRRPDVVHIDQVWAGLRTPVGTEEIGTWVRIGIDHTTLGTHWAFRGFVDAVVPTYVPDRDDAVRIECIDSLGEAGRVFVDGGRLSYRFTGAPRRIRQILDGAHWPAKLRAVHDDATLLSRPAASKAVDLLTHVAESCGGAVYGDPDTGNIVFKGQDWQGAVAAGPADAYITNLDPPVDVPIVCPTGWERSTRRSDMTTRVRFSTESSDTDDFHPLVFEWRHPEAEHLYGVELYERTLLCITRERVQELARRQLVLRNPNQFPRVEAVLLDASTATEALDLMTTATFTKPSKYRCQLHRPDQGVVFNRGMLVTGVRHRMTPAQWTTRLALDPASVFAEGGGRWGRAHWGRDSWGRTR